MVRCAHEGEIGDGLECTKAYTACIKSLLRERVAVLEGYSYAMGGVYQRGNANMLLRGDAGDSCNVDFRDFRS